MHLGATQPTRVFSSRTSELQIMNYVQSEMYFLYFYGISSGTNCPKLNKYLCGKETFLKIN